jgi:hypothetical protein
MRPSQYCAQCLLYSFALGCLTLGTELGSCKEQCRSVHAAYAYASKSYIAKKVEFEFERPGRFWGVIARQNLKFGKVEVVKLTEGQAIKLRRVIRLTSLGFVQGRPCHWFPQ